MMMVRGGPQKLEDLQLSVVYKSEDYVVINKGWDTRLDGEAYVATIEKALHRDFPSIDKFRWIHQLDFATSGIMCIGLNKPATAAASQLFEQKLAEKEYVAIVDGHIPFTPGKHQKQVALSNLRPMILQHRKASVLRQKLKNKASKPSYVPPPKSNIKGPRVASAYLQMEHTKLKRKRDDCESLTLEEEELLSTKWKEMTKSQKERFYELERQDKIRFMNQVKEFEESSEATTEQALGSASPTALDTNDTSPVVGPIGYLFDQAIAEPKKPGVFNMEIGSAENPGREAMTVAFVLEHGHIMINDTQRYPVSKVLLRPLSGRRHQLRLHLKHFGHPIVGDATYNTMKTQGHSVSRMMLHAWKLKLPLQPSELEFKAPSGFEQYYESEGKSVVITTF